MLGNLLNEFCNLKKGTAIRNDDDQAVKQVPV